jgi:hypothetical protein
MSGRRRRPDEQWSAAGAARFAREARTHAVLHLRQSPSAHTWIVELVQAWTGMQERLLGGPLPVALYAALAPMGYPPLYRSTVDQYAEQLRHDLAQDLTRTELYVMSPAMADVTVAAAHTLTLSDFMTLTEDDLPSPAGLLVLPRPLLVVNGVGDVNDIRAIAWAPMSVDQIDEPPRPGVRVVGLLDTYGPVENDMFTAMLTQARRVHDPFPPLLVSTLEAMPYRWEREPSAAELAHIRDTNHALAAESDRIAAQRGFQPTRVEGEHLVGSQIHDPDTTFLRRFLFAFWRLCEQRIATTDTAPAGHAGTLMAHRIGATPDVCIVALRKQQRRAEGPGEPDAAHPVAWTTRWTVKMHKVSQWYPSEQTHKVLWRGPYVKGPEGLPLKDAPTVNALVR